MSCARPCSLIGGVESRGVGWRGRRIQCQQQTLPVGAVTSHHTTKHNNHKKRRVPKTRPPKTNTGHTPSATHPPSHSTLETRKNQCNMLCGAVRYPPLPVDALRLPQAHNSPLHVSQVLLAHSHPRECVRHLRMLIPNHPAENRQRLAVLVHRCLKLALLTQHVASATQCTSHLHSLEADGLPVDPIRLVEHRKRILMLLLTTVNSSHVHQDLGLCRIPLGMVPTHNPKPLLVLPKRLLQHALIRV
mmetsp:Transcript_30405/g.73317  ORF Transcript_30405/g.73317 Transcript_30405/m.73317 type:complete len:246 (+) Transcript_30405:73-810(+)